MVDGKGVICGELEGQVSGGATNPTHELRFAGKYDGAMVPASVLAETLQATQRVVHLLAMATLGRSLGQRARVPQDIERSFPVLCAIPRPGSYIAPFQIGDPSAALLSPIETGTLSAKFDAVLAAAEAGDAEAFRAAVPNSRWREAVTDAVGRMPPRPSTGFSLSVRSGQRDRTFALSAARERIATLSIRSDTTSATRPVIGTLLAIDFAERKLRLRYPVTHRVFDCIYADVDDIEPVLFANARELVQIIGTVEVDAADHPVRVVEVVDIRPVDLEPMAVPVFTIGNVVVKPIGDRMLRPGLDETSQIFTLVDSGLGIDLACETRAELEDALRHLLPLLWADYARAADAELTGDARELKHRLLAAFTEVPHAAPEQ